MEKKGQVSYIFTVLFFKLGGFLTRRNIIFMHTFLGMGRVNLRGGSRV